jgi:hypothetical protein
LVEVIPAAATVRTAFVPELQVSVRASSRRSAIEVLAAGCEPPAEVPPDGFCPWSMAIVAIELRCR